MKTEEEADVMESKQKKTERRIPRNLFSVSRGEEELPREVDISDLWKVFRIDRSLTISTQPDREAHPMAK